MNLRIKTLDIFTGVENLTILNREDAILLDLHANDRIKIINKKKIETLPIVITTDQNTVPPGKIGIFKSMVDSLKVKNNQFVKIIPAKKPLSLDLIRKKLDGGKLSKKEIDQIVWDIVHNKLSDVELAYFVAACYTNVLTINETIQLIKSMVEHGDTLNIKKYPIIDKHCIGGIPGNRTSMIIVPIIAAAGYTIPKTSSRSITSPAGTADTMEVLSNVSFSLNQMKSIINKANACIVWGGSLNLAPADDKIINVEKPLEIDAESQLLASIMAKKHSVSSTHILIDIPVGTDAKVKNKIKAFQLRSKFKLIGKKLGKNIKVILTDGRQPIGNGVGPALEARDVLWVLKQDSKRPRDLEKKSLMMAGKILEMVGQKSGLRKATKILKSGLAYDKFIQIIKLQGGEETLPDDIKLGKFSYKFKANKSGRVDDIDNIIISRTARIAGAPLEKSAGLYIYKHINDKVKKGDLLFTLYSNTPHKLNNAIEFVTKNQAFSIKKF
tara:strand:- start:3482 stop:4972 length:1491 start_codon:yes stop_codon:yes gene_type:complete